MIEKVMRHINNFFEQPKPLEGSFEIRDGVLDGVPDGYIYISGSTSADGVYLCEHGVLQPAPQDMTFVGWVWLLNPPRAFLELCKSIEEFEAKMPELPVTAQSFGAYSRTLAQGKNGRLSWQERFAAELTPYRHMFTEV